MFRDAMESLGLTQREIEVALKVAEGLCSKDVGAKLFVTEKTVKFHLTNIYRKLPVKSRSQLIVWAGVQDGKIEKPEIELGPGVTRLHAGIGTA